MPGLLEVARISIKSIGFQGDFSTASGATGCLRGFARAYGFEIKAPQRFLSGLKAAGAQAVRRKLC